MICLVLCPCLCADTTLLSFSRCLFDFDEEDLRKAMPALREKHQGLLSDAEVLSRTGFGALTLVAKRFYMDPTEQLRRLGEWEESIRAPKGFDPLDDSYVRSDQFDEVYANVRAAVAAGWLSGELGGNGVAPDKTSHAN